MSAIHTLIIRLIVPALLGVSCGLTACQSLEKRPTSIQPVSLLEEAPQPYRVSELISHSFERFLLLCQTGKPIPHALIFEHTLLTNPVGDFFATEIRPIYGQIEGILLVQLTKDCQRTYLMTTDGSRIIDQALIAENCPNEVETTRSTFYWQGNRHVVRTYMKSVSAPKDLPRATYQIAPSGGIELVETTNR